MNVCRSCLLFPCAFRPPSSLSEGCFQASPVGGGSWHCNLQQVSISVHHRWNVCFCTKWQSLCALSVSYGNPTSIVIFPDEYWNLLFVSPLPRSAGIRSVVLSLRRLCILLHIPCISHIFRSRVNCSAAITRSPDAHS